MKLKLLTDYPAEPLGTNTTWLMLQLARANDAQAQAAWEKVEGQPAAFLLAQRLGSQASQIDRRILTIVASACANPMNVVLWAHTLYHLSKGNAGYYYLSAFSSDFIKGFPSESTLRDAWQAQKETNPPGNYLDRSEAWQ